MKQEFVVNILKVLALSSILVIAKDLAVVEFQAKTQVFNNNIQEYGLLKTHEITICFRFMTRMNPNFSFFNMNQLDIKLKDDGTFLTLKSWNARDLTESYSRMFQMCQTYVPGQWMSLCFSVKLTENRQEITFLQDGELCSENIFLDGNFDWIFYKSSITVADL